MGNKFGIISAYKPTHIVHTLFCLALGIFFIYSGVKKFTPKKPRLLNETEVAEAVKSDHFPKPLSFKLCVKMMRASGFLNMVGVLQILSGVLIVFHKTRLVGLLLLLPLTVNIFTLHAFMDNRMDENIKTGLLLLANIGLILPYYRLLFYSLFDPDFN